MGRLLNEATDVARLTALLDEMRAGDAEDGAAGDGLARLAADADHLLGELSSQVRNSTFVPGALTAIDIPKGNGGVRELALPRPIERVLERSILGVLWPIVDPYLGPCAYGFRPGLGVGDAVRELVAIRELGFGWAVRVDIHDCFPSIPRQRLRRLLAAIVPDEELLNVIDLLLERPVRDGKRLSYPPIGLPQGSPLSPLFTNLYLAAFDEAVTSAGFPLVRYADDIVICAPDEQGARRAMEVADNAAQSLDLQLGADKREVLDFATGFAFLGEEINHRYPPATSGHRMDDPGRRTMYVGVQGAYVAARNGRVVVTDDKVELLSAPSGHVGRLVVFGGVTLSSGLRTWAFDNDVDVVMCSRRGALQGWLAPPPTGTAAFRRAQFKATENDGLCVAVGRAIERGKLHNQRVLLQRAITPAVADDLREPIEQIARLSDQLAEASTREEVMGIEGMAARFYFEGLRALLPDDLGFDGRKRRPPGDVVNAALGYGYAILLGDAVTACASAGLDPTVGFLHADHEHRASLALDLVEEFRPLIVDAAVLALVNNGSIGVGQGRAAGGGKGGVLLTEDGRRKLTGELERRLLTEAYHVPSQRTTSYRRMMHLQAQQLAAVVRAGECHYQPVMRRV